MAPGNQLNKTPTYQPIAPVRELESTMPKVMECNQSHHLECIALILQSKHTFRIWTPVSFNPKCLDSKEPI